MAFGRFMALTYHLKCALIAFKLLAACIAALGIKPIQNQPASLKSVHLYSFITSQVHDTTITHLEPFLSTNVNSLVYTCTFGSRHPEHSIPYNRGECIRKVVIKPESLRQYDFTLTVVAPMYCRNFVTP